MKRWYAGSVNQQATRHLGGRVGGAGFEAEEGLKFREAGLLRATGFITLRYEL